MKNSTKNFARKPLALLLALLMVACSAPWAGMVAFAAGGSEGLSFDIVEFNYEFATGENDEEGKPIMDTNVYPVMAVTGYSGEGGDIVVPTTYGGMKVEYVSALAFADCDNITSISLPVTVKGVGEMAFANCTSLQKVMFGIEGAQAASAFADFSEYGYITQVLNKAVGDKAFMNCTSLRYFAVASARATLGVISTAFGTNVFLGCDNLTFCAYGDRNIIQSYYEANKTPTLSWSYLNLSTAVAETDVKAEPANVLMAISETKTLGVEFEPVEAGFSRVSFISSNPSVASVDVNGKVTALSYGWADITVTSFHGFTAVCRINVADKIFNEFSYRETDDGKIEILGCNSGIAGEVVVPAQILGKTVSKIGDNAFRNCTGITKITLPAGVTEIGSSAFYGCTGLKEVVFDGTSMLKSIGGHAFYGCTALSSINLPASLEVIGIGAFRGCTALAAVITDTKLTAVGAEAFMDCSSLVLATIKSSSAVIGKDAFKNASGNLVIYGAASSPASTYASSNGITFKALATVAGVSGITINASKLSFITGESVAFTATLTPAVTADKAWSSSDISVATVDQNGKVTSHKQGAAVITVICANGISDKETITVANGVDGDYQYCLVNNASAAQIVKYTGSAKEVEVPATIGGFRVVSLGASVFKGASVTKVTLPESVISVSGEAFDYAYDLEAIEVAAANTNYRAISGVLFTADKKTLVKYPAARSGDDYEVPGEVTSLGVCAFEDSRNLINIELSENLKTISAYAFDNCLKLMNVNVPASVTSIGDRAFAYCASLQYVTIPQSVCAFGNDVFKNSPEATLYGRAASDSEEYAINNSVPFALIDDLVEVTGLTLSSTAKTLARQDTYQLTATLLPFGATYPVVTYKSNDSSIATVDDSGLVTGVAEGTTTIVVTTCKGISESCIITVSGDPTVIPELDSLEIKVQPDKNVYYVGDALDLSGIVVYALYSNGDTEKIINEAGTTVSGVRLRGFDSATAGSKTVEIIYLEKVVSFDVTVKEKEIQKIEVTNLPAKMAYLEGEALDTTDLEVTAYYDDGSTEIIYDYDVSTFNSLPPAQKIEVTYQGCKASFLVTVTPKNLTGIKVSSLPKKVVYLEGEELDLEGLVISGIYNNGTTTALGEIPTVTGYNKAVIGKQVLNVECAGFTTTFEVTVRQKELSGLEIKIQPDKTIYYIGEAIDLTGIVVYANYTNGDAERIINDDGGMVMGVRLRGFDSNIPGSKTVEIIYREKTVTFQLTVKEKEAKRISITKAPDKLTYLEGERLDTTGMEVTVYYDDGSQELVYDYAVSEFNSVPAGQRLEVSYEGFKDYFVVTVIAKTLSGIKVTKAPEKVEYTEGEELDIAGLEISGVYNNGTVAVINDVPSVTGFNPLKVGKQTVTVSYGGFDSSFDVTVKARTLDRIEVISPPTKTEYILGETLDLDGMIVIAYFDNGTTAVLAPESQYEIDTYKLNLGRNDISISFSYGDSSKSTTFTVWVMLGKSGDYTYKVVNGNEVCLMKINKANAVGNVTVPSQVDGMTVSELAAGLYDGCDYMTGVVIPDTVTKINEKAFANCDVLKSAQLPTGLEVVPSQCFYNCPKLGEIEIPDTVSAIEDHAFAGCTELTKVTIPASVVYIAPHAFRDCPNLTIWGVPGSAAAEYAAENGIPFRYLPPYIKGDLDGNGLVTAADARLALRVATKLETIDADGFAAGDLNSDGIITAQEARTILRVATKLESFAK
ncbi:MAG: leucine-rich repeat protein [Clostridiales bacterium]|nr:leucine-rich repeat protein [Clostridiales bacterium]